MLGFDFYNFWHTGRAVLSGSGPYSVGDSFYPPAMAYLFTLLALLPFNVSFGLYTGLNFILFRKTVLRFQKGWQGIAWLAFAPVTFVFLTGQNDLLFLWAAGFLTSKGWKAILAAVLVTLKPQIAFIVLPWFLLQWLLHERRQLVWWAAGTLTLHALPLLIDPLIYQKWLASAGGESNWRLPASPGVFSLTNLNVPLVLIGILAVAIIVIGLVMKSTAMFSRTAQVLALPAGMWYENVFLIGSAPWWLLVPLSWVLFIVANQVHSNVPFVLIPLFSFIWQYFHKTAKIVQPQAQPVQA